MFPLFRKAVPLSLAPGSEVELSRTFQLAFQLAQESGRTVGLAMEPGRCCLAPKLRGPISLGVPVGVPLPSGMLDPRWAQVPKLLRVSPWHTATEGMWFLQDQQGPLCMHLTAKGQLRFLRYQVASHQWRRTPEV